MLVGELIEEGLLELGQRGVHLSGDRDGLSLILRCVYLDQRLELVVVDVICRSDSGQ